ncbi:MAG: protease pro-enzyme activation domain-containing protein, partial [Saccharolobus sp.]
MLWNTVLILFLILSGVSIPVSLYNFNTNQPISTLPPNTYLTVSIVLPPNNLALLQQYVQQHVILNISQIEKLFIPHKEISEILYKLNQMNISAINYLNVIVASGTVNQLEKALNGKFYTYNFKGNKFYEFYGSPAFSNAIVIGTNVTSLFLDKPITLYNITQAVAYTAVTPNQLQQAYNITWLYKHGITGNGTTIGILDFDGDPYIEQQLKTFDATYNISDPPFLKIVPIGPYNPNDGIASGWAMEISLDVEYAHVIA